MKSRPIPGSVAIDGREFIYIQCPADKKFNIFFNDIGTFNGAPYPKSGGSINEEAVLTLSDGVRLHCVSYKGDLRGWRDNIEAMCRAATLIYGKINGGLIIRSDGKSEPISDCKLDY